VGKRRLAESGRTVEEEMVERFSPPPCRRNGDGKVLLDLFLPVEVAEALRTQAGIER
jgi:hypothetical protein